MKLDVRNLILEHTSDEPHETQGETDLPSLLERIEIMEEQQTDDFCQTSLEKMVANTKSPFLEDIDGVLCRCDPNNSSLNQVFLPM